MGYGSQCDRGVVLLFEKMIMKLICRCAATFFATGIPYICVTVGCIMGCGTGIDSDNAKALSETQNEQVKFATLILIVMHIQANA